MTDTQLTHEPDLDLLDDELRHLCCGNCYPDLTLGVPFIAVCGRRAVGFRGHSLKPPDNACPDCLALVGEPCPECGEW